MRATFAHLTQEQFDLLFRSPAWKIEELDPLTIKLTPLIQRKHQLLGGFVSGDLTGTRRLNGQDAVLGLDIIVHEEKPYVHRGEGNVNTYHYIVTKTGRSDFPYAIHGPYTEETLIGHWPTGLPLDAYSR